MRKSLNVICKLLPTFIRPRYQCLCDVSLQDFKVLKRTHIALVTPVLVLCFVLPLRFLHPFSFLSFSSVFFSIFRLSFGSFYTIFRFIASTSQLYYLIHQVLILSFFVLFLFPHFIHFHISFHVIHFAFIFSLSINLFLSMSIFTSASNFLPF